MRRNGNNGNNWAEFEATEPAFAEGVRKRFGAYRHHVLATVRADGSPRLTGLEASFSDGELWLGMMPGSRKALDLRRDPRFALHANPGHESEMAEGDVRVAGRAYEVTDPAVLERFGQTAPEGELPEVFHLFRTELTEAVRTSVEGDRMVLRIWHPGTPLRVVRRGNDNSAPVED